MTDAPRADEMKFQSTAAAVRRALESADGIKVTNVHIQRIMQTHNIDTDIETVRIELTFEIKPRA